MENVVDRENTTKRTYNMKTCDHCGFTCSTKNFWRHPKKAECKEKQKKEAEVEYSKLCDIC